MNNIASDLRKLNEMRQELYRKQVELESKQRRIIKKANKSAFKPEAWVNSIGQTIRLGDLVVLVRGGRNTRLKSIMGQFSGVNMSPAGDEIRSVRVTVTEYVKVYTGADGKTSNRWYWQLKEPVNTTIVRKTRKIAAPPHRVFAIVAPDALNQ
jgi:hypothetical protein